MRLGRFLISSEGCHENDSPQVRTDTQETIWLTSLFLTHKDASEDTLPKIFDAEHAAIVDFYGKNLPKPSAELSLCTVIPSYAEWDHVWKYFESLVLEPKIKNLVPQFEAIMVVNNPTLPDSLEKNLSDMFHEQAGVGTNNLEELKDRRSKNRLLLSFIRIYQENMQRDITAFLKALKQSGISLNMYQEKIARLLHKFQVRIVALDLSSPGKSLPPNTSLNPVGYSRHVGGHVAYDRLGGNGNGWIDFLDGDSWYSKGALDALIRLSSDKRTSVIYKHLQPVLHEIAKPSSNGKTFHNQPENKLLSFFRKRKKNTENAHKVEHYTFPQLAQAVQMYLEKHYADLYDRYEGASFDVSPKTWAGGPQLCVRAKQFRESGGYSSMKSNADFDFSSFFIKSFKGYIVPKYPTSTLAPPVLVSDRGRLGSIDGNDRRLDLGANPPLNILLNEKIHDLKKTLYYAVTRMIELNEQTRTMITSYGDQQYVVRYDQLLKTHHESILRATQLRRKTLNDVFYAVIDKDKKDTRNSQTNKNVQELLRVNPMLSAIIQGALSLTSNEMEAGTLLRQLFPMEFNTPDHRSFLLQTNSVLPPIESVSVDLLASLYHLYRAVPLARRELLSSIINLDAGRYAKMIDSQESI